LADFGKVIELEPAHAGAYFYRGVAHGKLVSREVAAADLERALDLGLGPSLKEDAEELLRELDE
jgi:hypothetical protein